MAAGRFIKRQVLRFVPRDLRERIKTTSELRFWRESWDQALHDGSLWGLNTLELSGDAEVAPTYEGRRWQQARAEVARILVEAGIEDRAFFDGKVVVDVGSGPLGFPDACPADVSIAVEPLTDAYASQGLLLDSSAVYLAVSAERIPLRSQSVDVVVSRNSLDHVGDPQQALAEMCRLLRPGGHLILHVELDHRPTSTEPHEIRLVDLHAWLHSLTTLNQERWEAPPVEGVGTRHGVVIFAQKPG